MSDEKVSLLPCPCCGSRARFQVIAPDAQFNAGGEYVDCSECGLSTNLMFPLKTDVREELTERWNRRASADERQRAIEEAAKELEAQALHARGVEAENTTLQNIYTADIYRVMANTLESAAQSIRALSSAPKVR